MILQYNTSFEGACDFIKLQYIRRKFIISLQIIIQTLNTLSMFLKVCFLNIDKETNSNCIKVSKIFIKIKIIKIKIKLIFLYY